MELHMNAESNSIVHANNNKDEDNSLHLLSNTVGQCLL
jgi:hypothetical protein